VPGGAAPAGALDYLASGYYPGRIRLTA
jgi:hypothetical protein